VIVDCAASPFEHFQCICNFFEDNLGNLTCLKKKIGISEKKWLILLIFVILGTLRAGGKLQIDMESTTKLTFSKLCNTCRPCDYFSFVWKLKEK
jgi:hypothetical protein